MNIDTQINEVLRLAGVESANLNESIVSTIIDELALPVAVGLVLSGMIVGVKSETLNNASQLASMCDIENIKTDKDSLLINCKVDTSYNGQNDNYMVAGGDKDSNGEYEYDIRVGYTQNPLSSIKVPTTIQIFNNTNFHHYKDDDPTHPVYKKISDLKNNKKLYQLWSSILNKGFKNKQ